MTTAGPVAVAIPADFPWKRLFMKQEDLLTMFAALSSLQPADRVVKTDWHVIMMPQLTVEQKRLHLSNTALGDLDGQYIMAIYDDMADYLSFNMLSDYWTEEERLSAFRRGHESPLTYWSANKTEILSLASQGMSADDAKSPLIVAKAARELVYAKSHEVSSQRPMALFILLSLLFPSADRSDHYHLEMCCGFGNNLIACLAAGVGHFHGVEPRASLHPKYAEIVQTLDSKRAASGTYTTYVGGFEDVQLDNQFDSICFSPPYWDFEVYDVSASSSSQSIVRHATFGEWYDNFLLASCVKAWAHLRHGGYFLLIANHTTKRENYIYRLLADMKEVTGGSFCGTLPFGRSNGTKVQPFFVWQKEG